MRHGSWAALLLVLCALPALARAGERPGVIINPGRDDKTYRVAVQHFAAKGGADSLAGAVYQALLGGLEFSSLFTHIDERAFLDGVDSPLLDGAPAPNCPNWRQIGADALVQGEVEAAPEGVRATFRLYDVSRGCLALVRGKRFTGRKEDVRRVGKAIADEIVGAFTGQRGVADTELAFVSTRSGTKEIWVMDADGGNARAATSNRSLSSFPDWDPAGSAVVYTSYRYRNRPSLFLVSRGPSSPGRILAGLNGGKPIYRGVFDRSGQRLAIVMSGDGNTELFTVERGGGALRRLTRNGAIDVSPTWSPDGRQIAFVSDRSGTPQVYVMNADGSNQRRLTFQGVYNTSPAWSPDGRWIAYETQLGGQFDIWLIDPDGQTNVPLVTHARSDEHPTWSPDSRKLAFQSTRRGRADIWVMDVAGREEQARRVSEGGENTDPAWGPYRR